MSEDSYQPTPRTRLKRNPSRAAYDRETVHAIIDAGLICHVGYVIDEEEDYDWDVWAGVVPIRAHIGEPLDDPRLKPGISRPDYLAGFRLG